MSDYSAVDGRPAPEFGPLQLCDAVSEEVYVYHHGGRVGLEIGPWPSVPGSPRVAVTIGLTADQARYVADELLDRAKDVDRPEPADG